MKNSEGNPQMKARQAPPSRGKTVRQMLQDVPKADVIVTNPTHFAIALRYDRKTMKAPKIVRHAAQRAPHPRDRHQASSAHRRKQTARADDVQIRQGRGGHSGPALRGGRRDSRLRLSRQPLPLLRRAKPRFKSWLPSPTTNTSKGGLGRYLRQAISGSSSACLAR